MTMKQIEAAAAKAVERNEDLQLLQALEWFNDYGLIDYKRYHQISNALTKAWRTAKDTTPGD